MTEVPLRGAGCRQGAGRRRLGAGTFLEDEGHELLRGQGQALIVEGGGEKGRREALGRLWSRPPLPPSPILG